MMPPAIHLLAALAICLFYTVACWGGGQWLLAGLRRWLGTGAEDSPTIAFLTGAGGAAILWCLLLAAGLFVRPVIVSVLALMVCGGLPGLKAARAALREHFHGAVMAWRGATFGWKVLMVLMGLLLVVVLQRTLAPMHPRNDATAFYLVLPKLLSATGELRLLGGYELFGTIGLLGEFHYAALMALGLGSRAVLFSVPLALAVLALLWQTTRRLGLGHGGRLLALSMLLGSSAFYKMVGDGKVDIFALAFGLAAIALILPFRGVRPDTSWVVCGFMMGLSVVAKISYLPLVTLAIAVGMGAAIAQTPAAARKWRLALRQGMLVAAGMLAPIAMHLFKNAVLYGEPLAPFHIFHTEALRADWTDQAWLDPATTCRLILTYPLALVFGDFPMQGGTLSTLWLAALPLALLVPLSRPLRHNPLVIVTVAGVLGLVAWIFLRPSVFAPRYMMVALALLFPLGAAAAAHAIDGRHRAGWLSTIVLMLFCVGVADAANSNRIYNRKAAKKYTAAAPLRQASQFINQTAAPGTRVMSLNYFTYWYREDLLQCMSGWNDGAVHAAPPDRQVEMIYRHGFDYVVLDTETHGTMLPALERSEPSGGGARLEKVFHQENYRIYRVWAAETATTPRWRTEEMRAGVWRVVQD